MKLTLAVSQILMDNYSNDSTLHPYKVLSEKKSSYHVYRLQHHRMEQMRKKTLVV